jgi:glycosyltransferase involved in cell wall biosynthesis
VAAAVDPGYAVNRLRILVVASWYRSRNAPVRGSFIREQALALAHRGHEVHVVFADPAASRWPLTVRRTSDGPLTQHAIAAPWPLHRVLGFYLPQVLVWRLRRVMLEVRPDVVHAHAARPAAVLATQAATRYGAPVLMTEHKSNLRTFWLTRHGWLQLRNAYERCERLFAVSNGLKDTLERSFPSTRGRWVVNYNAVDTQLFRIDPARRHSLQQTQRRILFLGGLTARKGLSTLLEALARLPPQFALTVAGPGASPERVLALARAFGVQARVTAVGLVDRSSVAALLNEHHVLAVPSYQETFGLVCAEALACGTPVVASRCGGPEEIVTPDLGRIVEPRDSVALASALELVASSAWNWQPERARAYIEERFSMTALAVRLERHYASVAHRA